MTNTLVFSHVRKRYGTREVLRDACLTLASGTCVALTGPNGCGKSTLLRIAGGLTRPDGGTVTVARGTVVQYVPETFPRLDLTLRRYLAAMEKTDCRETLALAEAFGLSPALDTPIRGFSKGMLSKVSALQALCAPSGLLLLDEPVSGQDRDSRAFLIQRVQAVKAKGTAVLMACHEEALMAALADRVCRVADGEIQEGLAETPRCLCGGCPRLARGLCAGGGDCHG